MYRFLKTGFLECFLEFKNLISPRDFIKKKRVPTNEGLLELSTYIIQSNFEELNSKLVENCRQVFI